MTCKSVSKIYRSSTGEIRALHEVDFTSLSHQVSVVMGPSGSGKSSLLRILSGLDSPSKGQVEINSTDLSSLSARRRRKFRQMNIGYVFQRPSDNLIGYLTVKEHMALAAGVRGADRRECDALLSALGIRHRAQYWPEELSGGEQQRLSFALAAVGSRRLILADEPTAELDAATGELLLAKIKDLAQTGISVIVATHDSSVAAAADAVFRLEEGRVAT